MKSGIILFIIFLILLSILVLVVVDNYKMELKEKVNKLLYLPRKSREIYDVIWVQGGAINSDLKNTLSGFESIACCTKTGMGISTSIRLNREKIFYCFNNRYTYRLLGTPGKFSNKTSEQIEIFSVMDTEEKVPTLEEALNFVNSRVPMLLEVKSCLNKEEVKNLYYVVSSYKGKLYFQCKNIITYFRLKAYFKDKVFFKFNLLRKRFNFLSGISYQKEKLPIDLDISLALEENDTVQNVLYKIWYAANRHITRIKDDDPLLVTPIAHRGILDKGDPEHSIESIKKCIKYGVIPEFDVTMYGGELICYHSDRFSGKVIKQPASCAEKMNISDSHSVKEILEAINVPEATVVLDIKDAHYRIRRLEELLISQIEEIEFKGTIYVQCFNPFVVRWFYKNYPKYKRGIVCNSLSGIKGLPQWFRTLVNALLSSYCKPEYIAYDFGRLVPIFSKLITTIGLPVLLYAPKSKSELKEYRGFYQNVIGENYLDLKSWNGLYGFDKEGKLVRLRKY